MEPTSPITPRPGQITFGIGLIAFATWLLFSWIPDHRPLDFGDQAAFTANALRAGHDPFNHWMLTERAYTCALGFAVVAGLLGVYALVSGATHRQRGNQRRVRRGAVGLGVLLGAGLLAGTLVILGRN